MRALLISDLHLSEADRATHAKFLAFARGPARKADRLYILGDLFHHWLGDAQIHHDPYAVEVVRELKAISDAGCKIALLVGNRDFMIGQAFCNAIGARFFDGPTLEDFDGQPILLLHGDELCTDDIGYQRARKILRHPLFKPMVAPLPYSMRLRIANYLRRKSAAHKRTLSSQIMDVTESAVCAMFHQKNVQQMIHGHTHRPNTHTHTVDGRACTRTVLADWQTAHHYTAWEHGALQNHNFT
jgi:UDP-2,3-diacylglucosamine hydrolase